MVFILLGVVMLGLKVAELAPVAEWSWFVVLAPFPLALVWWLWSDLSGRTRRRAMRSRCLRPVSFPRTQRRCVRSTRMAAQKLQYRENQKTGSTK